MASSSNFNSGSIADRNVERMLEIVQNSSVLINDLRSLAESRAALRVEVHDLTEALRRANEERRDALERVHREREERIRLTERVNQLEARLDAIASRLNMAQPTEVGPSEVRNIGVVDERPTSRPRRWNPLRIGSPIRRRTDVNDDVD